MLYPCKFGSTGQGNIVDLGTGKTFDVSQYAGYGSFTADNFIVCAKGGSYNQSQNMGTQNTVQNITPSATCNISVNKSYNASTGILTANETVNIYASCSMYRDGNIIKTTPTKVYTNDVHVYLIRN